jgi:hypothetical protein
LLAPVAESIPRTKRKAGQQMRQGYAGGFHHDRAIEARYVATAHNVSARSTGLTRKTKVYLTFIYTA